MIVKTWCDKEKCPLHPDYKEKIVETQIYDAFNSHTHSISPNGYYTTNGAMASTIDYRAVLVDTKITFNNENLSIPVECFVCEHMKKVDMKEVLMLNKAKELLKR